MLECLRGAQSVLFVTRTSALAAFVARWVCVRQQEAKDTWQKLLSRLHVVFEVEGEAVAHDLVYDARLGRVKLIRQICRPLSRSSSPLPCYRGSSSMAPSSTGPSPAFASWLSCRIPWPSANCIVL